MPSSSPTPPPAPMPDYNQDSSAAVNAQLTALPQQLKIQQAANLGEDYTDPNTGTNYNFSGLGQEAQLNQELALYQQSAPQIAQQNLSLQQQMDPQQIALENQDLQQSDPTSYALHQAYNTQALNNLNLGDQLSSDQLRNIQQQTRQAQTARGNYMGANPSEQEAFNSFGYGQQLQQSRQANAASALGLGSSNQQYASLQGAQQGPVSYSPQAPQLPFGVNPNAGQSGVNLAAQTYGSEVALYNSQLNAPNPWAQIGGMAAGAGVTLGAAAMMA